MLWDPKQYAQFAGERSRPFFDLLAQVRNERVLHAADLGCGPGELTQALAKRWPQAQVVGVDNSPEMLAKSAPSAIPNRLRFLQADIGAWQSDRPLDLIFSNAALQWVPDHEKLLDALVGMLAPGGTLAVQVPNHFASPAHQLIKETVQQRSWKSLLDGAGLQAAAVKPLTWYVERLVGHGLTVDAWDTTYIHVLHGENPVLEWMKGTALRPLLSRLDSQQSADFLRDLGTRYLAAYPASGHGFTLFPFRRIFFIATRRG